MKDITKLNEHQKLLLVDFATYFEIRKIITKSLNSENVWKK